MISGLNYVPFYLVVKRISLFQFESNPSQCEFNDGYKNISFSSEKPFPIHSFTVCSSQSGIKLILYF